MFNGGSSSAITIHPIDTMDLHYYRKWLFYYANYKAAVVD